MTPQGNRAKGQQGTLRPTTTTLRAATGPTRPARTVQHVSTPPTPPRAASNPDRLPTPAQVTAAISRLVLTLAFVPLAVGVLAPVVLSDPRTYALAAGIATAGLSGIVLATLWEAADARRDTPLPLDGWALPRVLTVTVLAQFVLFAVSTLRDDGLQQWHGAVGLGLGIGLGLVTLITSPLPDDPEGSTS